VSSDGGNFLWRAFGGPRLVSRSSASLELGVLGSLDVLPVLPGGRGAIPLIHQYLRKCILDGRLAPGETVSQVQLAKALGVSRTPVREVMRLLQEEGLVENETNQRSRVAGFDPVQLDSDYACRIMLEALALELTTPMLREGDVARLDDLLARMREAAAINDVDAWLADHAQFHGLLTSGASDVLIKQVNSAADRSIRYIRIIQRSYSQTWTAHGDTEHTAIVDALRDGQWHLARSTLGSHLARTALRVLTDLAPEYEPVAVRHALAMVSAPATPHV
jgi:DNA-binding GntR family transcriptional regulator